MRIDGAQPELAGDVVDCLPRHIGGDVEYHLIGDEPRLAGGRHAGEAALARHRPLRHSAARREQRGLMLGPMSFIILPERRRREGPSGRRKAVRIRQGGVEAARLRSPRIPSPDIGSPVGRNSVPVILFAGVRGFLTAAILALRGGGGGRSRATASPARLKAIASPANIDNARTPAGCLPTDGRSSCPQSQAWPHGPVRAGLFIIVLEFLDILRQSACRNRMWVNPSPNGRVVSRSETGWGFVRPSRAMRSPRLPHPAANAAKFTQAA